MDTTQEAPKNKGTFYLPKLLWVLVLLALVFMGYKILPAAPKSVADINANPQALNGLRFTKGNLKKLNIQNVHISGLVFDDNQKLTDLAGYFNFQMCETFCTLSY